MSTVYTLKTSNIEFVNADELSFNDSQFTNNNYKFKISLVPKTKKDNSITKTIYHSITNVKFTTAMHHFPVPIFEIKKVAALTSSNVTQPETLDTDF